MAPTKRKRRTKHRGTPAGTIEARGRTGRKLSAKERQSQQRRNRLDTPPSWNQAFLRAGFAAALLFVFTQIGLGPEMDIMQSLALCLFAMLIYVPLGYWTDRAIYNRRMRKRAQAQK